MDEEEEKDEVQYVKLVWKNPNPLFVKWITEWMEEARRRNLQLQYTLENALGSLKKFPIPLKSGKECLILEHFGSALCDKLDRELAKYNANKHDTAAIPGPSTSGNNRLAIKDFENKTKNETNVVPKPAAVLNHDVQSPKKSLEIKTKSPKKLFWDKPSASTLFDKPSHKNLFEYDTPVPNKLTQTKKPETVRSSLEGIFGPSTSSALNHLNTNEAYQFPPDNDRNVATTSFEHLTAVSRKETNLLPYRRKDAEGSPQKNGYPRRKPAALGAASENSTCEGTIDWEPKRLQKEGASPTKRKLTVPSPKKSPHKRNQRANPSLFADDNDTAPLSQLSSNGSCSQTVEEPFTFPPGDFVIKLLVDTAETFGNTAKRLKRQEEATTYLTELGVLFEVRRLPVGDFVWVCQDGSPKELLLPYIVERKRADDLAKSIKDGRFREQKFRLKQLPITHRIYLVEELKGDRSGLPLSTLMQAATNTQVIDGFKVTFTKNLKHSMQYLATMTEYLTETFNRKMLMSCSKERLPPLNLKDDYCLLMTFKDYARNTAKKRKYTVGEMFLKHLLQLRGMSVEKAKAVVRLYPTPSHLMEAYRNCQRSKRRMMLSKLQIGALGRSLGPVISVAIHDLYTKNEFN